MTRHQQAASAREPIILLIDGQCYLCHGITKFVVKRDPRQRFRFASLQSKLGQQLLVKGQMSTEDLDTFVMVDRGRYYTKSSAALLVMRQLGGLWPLLSIFRLVPKWLRDLVYDVIASRRYRWFGRSEQCLLPSAELRNRFLELVEADGDEKKTDLRRDRHKDRDG